MYSIESERGIIDKEISVCVILLNRVHVFNGDALIESKRRITLQFNNKLIMLTGHEAVNEENAFKMINYCKNTLFSSLSNIL